MTAQTLDLGAWVEQHATHRFEQRVSRSLQQYCSNHRDLIGAHPDQRQEIEGQLNLALRSQIEFAVWLAESSTGS